MELQQYKEKAVNFLTAFFFFYKLQMPMDILYIRPGHVEQFHVSR